jgi:hypothetical protein
MSDFYKYFRENMEALGLPAPGSIYGNAILATSTLKTIVDTVDKFGTKVTVRELLVAGVRAERLSFTASMSASYYAGAVVGSLAVATGRVLGHGTSLSDVLMTLSRYRLRKRWLVMQIYRGPKMFLLTALSAGRTR